MNTRLTVAGTKYKLRARAANYAVFVPIVAKQHDVNSLCNADVVICRSTRAIG